MSDILGSKPRSASRDRSVLASVLVFGLFFALQLSASFEAHEHLTAADSIECVACHGVRAVPVTPRAMNALAADVVGWDAPTTEPLQAARKGPDLTSRPTRGPPSA